jgi:hypothetical protein
MPNVFDLFQSKTPLREPKTTKIAHSIAEKTSYSRAEVIQKRLTIIAKQVNHYARKG